MKVMAENNEHQLQLPILVDVVFRTTRSDHSTQSVEGSNSLRPIHAHEGQAASREDESIYDAIVDRYFNQLAEIK